MHKIFIADDDHRLRKAMRLMLEGHGYDVVAAMDGRDLLRQLEKQKADLIVLDLEMPGLSGLEVLKTLRSDPRFSRIPVLMASAQDDDRTRIRCLSLGACEFRAKPFSLRSLVGSVEAHLALDVPIGGDTQC